MELLKHLAEWMAVTVIINTICRKFVADTILKYATAWFHKTERHAAIFQHYELRHNGKNVLTCGEGRCQIL